MFFFFSKALEFLLNPTNWLLASGVCWLLFKSIKVKRVSFIAFIVIFLIFSNGAIYRSALLNWQPPVVQPQYQQSYSAAILLTGMTKTNSQDQAFFGGNADRFIQTTRLFHSKVVQYVIISGGDGSILQNRPKEADFLRKEMLAQGIPDSAIIVDNQSRNTFENAVNCKKMVADHRLQPPYLLVTSAQHMPRAMATFSKMALPVIPHPANFEVLKQDYSLPSLLIPDIGTIGQWRYLIKEWVGLLVYRLTEKA